MSRYLGNAIGRTSGPIPTSTGDAVLLYNCAGCFNGSAVIPAGKLGVYSRYEITGQTGYWQYYCSSMTLGFAGACGGACADNFAEYCCAQVACGWIGRVKCFSGSYPYSCGGQIPWIFGCSSGCLSACSLAGYMWRISIEPENVCDGSQRGFRYCSATTHGPGGGEFCCIGIRNSGYAYNCCGAHPACLKSVCLSTPSSGNAFICVTSAQIYGYGKINV